MNQQRPLLLLILVIFIFLPTLFRWVISTDGAWYRPYIIWLLIIAVAYFYQRKSIKRNDI